MNRDPLQRSSAGFTLIELSVVIAIIAIVVGMGMTASMQMVESAQRAGAYSKLLTPADSTELTAC
jgi:prepilin-type N-terminal cleavage/methylation domain-containing protein